MIRAMASSVDLLISQAYEAALDPRGWPGVVRSLGTAFGGPAALVAADPRNAATNVSSMADFDPHYVRTYMEHYGRQNPWVREFARLPAGSLIYRALVPQLHLKSTEFYSDWLLPQGLEDALGGILDRPEGRMNFAVVMRPARAGPFTAEHHGMFRIGLAHIRRALKVHARLAGHAGERCALLDALDRGGLAAFLVTERRLVRICNRRGEAMLAAAVPFALKSGMLAMGHPRADAELARAVATAFQRRRSGIMALRHGEARPVACMVMPVSPPQVPMFDVAPDGPCALILVKSAEFSGPPDPHVIATLFGLTSAEARLAHALATGMSLDEVSGAFGVSYGTVRTQLRSIMQKTGTNRQGQLISLLCTYAL